MPSTRALLPLTLCLGASLGCPGAAMEQPAPPTAKQPGGPAAQPRGPEATRVAQLVSEHHDLDATWLSEATVVAVARLETGSYPCIFHEDGSTDMPMSRTFTVEEVLVRGPLGRDTIDLAPPGTPSERWPHDLRDGRRYLLFLSPSADSQALLASEDHSFGVYTQLHEPEIVAIVDLDATLEDVQAQRRAAQTHVEREAYVLDNARWQALRSTTGVTGPELMSALHALQTDRLPHWQTRAEALADLGDPDETGREDGETVDTYFVNLRDMQPPTEGRFVARIQLVSTPEGTLHAYREEFLVGRDGALEVAGYEEKKQAGLMWTHIERRR